MEFSSSALEMMMEMTASRKRLHGELEDGDECLPISKRIHSLHIEAQSYGINSQDSYEANGNLCDAFCSDTATTSLPVFVNSLEHPYQAASAPVVSCNHGLRGEASSSTRLPTTNEQVVTSPHELNLEQESNGLSGQDFLFASDVCSTLPNPGLKLDPVIGHAQTPASYQSLAHMYECSFYQSGELPSPNPEYCGTGNSSHAVSESASFSSLVDPLSSFQNLSSTPQAQFHSLHNLDSSTSHDVQNQQLSQNLQNAQLNIHICPSAVSHVDNMSGYSEEFHRQQLPTGTYEPELGVDENPFYFSVNRVLYEAHLFRVRRENNFSNNS